MSIRGTKVLELGGAVALIYAGMTASLTKGAKDRRSMAVPAGAMPIRNRSCQTRTEETRHRSRSSRRALQKF